MPLLNSAPGLIKEYVWKHIPNISWHKGVFNFVEDQSLRDRLAQEYVSARYIYKLGEALSPEGDGFYAHAKYQILQYASIYEAVIGYLLFRKYSDRDEVKNIRRITKYKLLHSLPSDFLHVRDGKESPVYICKKINEELDPKEIKFDHKVDAFVKIGLIEDVLGEEIKKIYKTRNGLHIENAVLKNIKYDLSLSKIAYGRMYPFTRQIKCFIEKGSIDANLKISNLSDSDLPIEAKG